MAIFHTDVTPPEKQLEALAARYGVRLDGVFDSRTAKMLVVRAALGELPLDRQSDAYLDSAIEALSGGKQPARADGTSDAEQRVDAAAAEARFRKATEAAWKNPTVGARADGQIGVDLSSVRVGPTGASYGTPTDPSKPQPLEAGPFSADERFKRETEQAWQHPTVGTSTVVVGPRGASYGPSSATPSGPAPAPTSSAKAVPPLDEGARARAHLERLESLWKNPTVGVTVV